MSCFFITGKPRGGKTFLGVKAIYEFLLNPKEQRPIVTNIGLYLDVMAEQLKVDQKLEFRPDLANRVRLLADDEVAKFWEFDVGREYHERRQMALGTWMANVPDFKDRGKFGCIYVIDEIHIYWPAQFGRMVNDDDLRFFLTQHGKMNIDVIFITQHPEQTSKVIRRLAQEYMNVRNLSREPYMGFRVGNMFRYVRSLNSPTSTNPASFESGFVSMDFKKFGAMYDTTKGVGIAGTVVSAPVTRGRHLAWLIIPAVLFLVGIWSLVFLAPKWIHKGAASFSKRANSQLFGASKFIVPTIPVGTNEIATTKNPQEARGALSGGNGMVTPEVFCRGYCMLPDGTYSVLLSDGRDAQSRWGEVVGITPRRVILFSNEIYQIKADHSYSVPVSEPSTFSAIPPPPESQPQETVQNQGTVQIIPFGRRGYQAFEASRNSIQERMQQHLDKNAPIYQSPVQ
jgi:hypothetical protein